MAEQTTIIVIGAGIIGLTSALCILDAVDRTKFNVIIVSEEWPTSIPGAPVEHSVNYASMWAGAHVRPIPASTPQLSREAAWLRRTCEVLEEQLKQTALVGVTRCKGIELLEAPPEDYKQQTFTSFTAETGLKNYRMFDSFELSQGTELGYEYDTFCINAPVYCASLLRSFISRGGKCLKRRLTSAWEGYSIIPKVTMVVNASGMGFGDSKCFPTRGQTVITDLNAADKTVTKQNKDGSWSFIIPRFFGGGTIVGGTKQPWNWSSEANADTRKSLLTNAGSIVSNAVEDPIDMNAVGVIADVVGRRPTREGGMRVEVEQPKGSIKGAVGPKPVVHAYGAGGRGFEISWGVAEEVVELLETELAKQQPRLQSKL